MQNITIDDLFYRNRRIRDFMQRFREKEANVVMRDIALLGIELFETMNPKIVYYSAEDVENTLASFVIDKDRKKNSPLLQETIATHPIKQDTNNYINKSHQILNEYYKNLDCVPQENTKKNCTYGVNNLAFQNNTVDNNIDLTTPHLPFFDENLSYNQAGVSQRPCRHNFRPESEDKAVPAGIPSYISFLNDEEEVKIKERSASKWRVDDSVYEAKAPRIKINRTSTEEFEKTKHQNKNGMNYPKWWGDNSSEKPKKSIATIQKSHNVGTNFYQLNPNLSKSATNFNRDMEMGSRWINYEARNPIEEAQVLLKDQREQVLKDKRQETRPNYSKPEHQSFTAPLKSVLRNAEAMKSRGGVALFYPMSEVGNNQNLDEYDRRQISPTRTAVIDLTHDSKERSKERSGSKGRSRAHLYHNRHDLEKFSCSPKQNDSLQKLHERDTEIALKRREKLESARNKEKVQPKAAYTHNYKNTKSRVSSVVKKDKKNQRYFAQFEKRSQSPTGNTGCLKRRLYEDKRYSEDDNTFDRMDDRVRTVLASRYTDLPHDDRGKLQRDIKYSKEKIYYKQEDLLKSKYEIINAKESDKKLNEEQQNNKFGPRIDITRNEIPSSNTEQDNIRSDEVLNRHNNRLSEFGFSLDQVQMYPYSKK